MWRIEQVSVVRSFWSIGVKLKAQGPDLARYTLLCGPRRWIKHVNLYEGCKNLYQHFEFSYVMNKSDIVARDKKWVWHPVLKNPNRSQSHLCMQPTTISTLVKFSNGSLYKIRGTQQKLKSIIFVRLTRSVFKQECTKCEYDTAVSLFVQVSSFSSRVNY